MKKNVETITAVLLALLMIIFGLNKFIGFIAVAPPDDPVAQQFMGAMFSSYLYVVVGLTEIIGGLFLLVPRLRFVGWLLQGAVVFNIVAFHFAHDFIGNGIWLIPTALFIVLGFFQLNRIVDLFLNRNEKTEVKKTVPTLVVVLLFFSLNLNAQNNYESIKVENQIIIDNAPEQVWELISAFDNLPKLVPDIVKKTEVNGRGVYSSWNIHLHNGQIVKEEMTYFNPIEMEFTYVMTKTAMPLSDYLAIQKVEEVNGTQSRIIFTTYFNTLPQHQKSLSSTFNKFQKTFLNNIKSNIK